MSHPPFSLEDIERAVGKNAFWLGQEFFEDGRVLALELSDAGRRLEGKVKDQQRQPFEQTVHFEQVPTGQKIVGHCTCPVNYNCKHVAASLLEAVGQWEELANALDPDEHLTLDNELWLQELERSAAEPPSDNYDAEERHRLVYILSRVEQDDGPKLGIDLKSVRLKNDESYGSTFADFNIETVLRGRPASFVRPVDVSILREVHWLSGHSHPIHLLPVGPEVSGLVKTIVSTGRCHYLDGHEPPLKWTKPLPGTARWSHSEQGKQRLKLTAESDLPILPAAPPLFVEPGSSKIGPLDFRVPDRIAGALLVAPEVRAKDAKALAEALVERFQTLRHLPLPSAPSDTENRNITPVPRLKLYQRTLDLDLPYFFQTRRRDWRPVGGEVAVPMADLSFDYAGENVPHHDTTQSLEALEGDILVELNRDFDFEAGSLGNLAEAGLTQLGDAVHMRAPSAYKHEFVVAPKLEQIEVGRWVDQDRWIRFLHLQLPKLKELGWHIDIDSSFPLKITAPPNEWWANLDETSGIDWFSFELGITIGDEQIDLLDTLRGILETVPSTISPEEANKILEERYKDQTLYHRLENGKVVPIEGNRLLPILSAILKIFGARYNEGEKFLVHVAQAAEFSEFVQLSTESGVNVKNADNLTALGEQLKRLTDREEAATPASFQGELRPYQAQGFGWLQNLRDIGFGGVLADDMGLGKTVQTLAHLVAMKSYAQAEGPVLLVAPTSLIPNWRHETERFAPTLKLLILHGPERKNLFNRIDDYDLVLTTYPLLARDQDIYLNRRFDTVILDEAQAIKNPKATVTQVAHKLDCSHRIALTGTPLENNLSELWSLFRFLIPGLLSDSATFRRQFRTPIEKQGDVERQRLLTQRLMPFLLRRTKDEVASDLPPKSEIIEYIGLEGSQRDLYETIRLTMHDKVRETIAEKGLAQSKITILDALMKLRQACCDPRLVKMEEAKAVKESAKMERLLELVPQMIAEGRRILLFSQFTSMLDLIQEAMNEREIPFLLLTGQTKDREKPVKAFQNGEAPIFLISLKAGGVGLNLTAADTVIHYDPWWNPAVERQATDRAHRIGQDKPVFVYKLIVKDAVEEAIQNLKDKKQELADALFDDQPARGFDLGDDELAQLFKPLVG